MTPEQLDRCVTEAYPRLVAEASRWVRPGDVYEPRDIVHTVLLGFRVRTLADFDYQGQAEWEKYVRMRIKGTIVDMWRVQDVGGDFKMRGDPAMDEVADERETALETLERQEDEAFLGRIKPLLPGAITCLTPKQLKVVEGRLAGYTFDQIAEAIGAADKTAPYYVFKRALLRLRKKLAPVLDGYTGGGRAGASR